MLTGFSQKWFSAYRLLQAVSLRDHRVVTATVKWAKTCRQQPSGSLYMLALFVSSQLWWTHLISQLSPALQHVIPRQERRRSLSNIKSVTLVTTGIQREASIRRRELNPKTTTEFGEDSAHKALCQSIFIFIALILRCFCSANQLFFFFFWALAHYYQKWHRPWQFVIYLECLSVLASSEQRQRGRANEETGAVLWLGEQRSQVLAARVPTAVSPSWEILPSNHLLTSVILLLHRRTREQVARLYSEILLTNRNVETDEILKKFCRLQIRSELGRSPWAEQQEKLEERQQGRAVPPSVHFLLLLTELLLNDEKYRKTLVKD